MNNNVRNIVVVVIVAVGIVYLMSTPNVLTLSFSWLQAFASLAFYVLGAIWFWNHRK